MYIIRNILAIGISPFSMNVAACLVVALLNTQLLHYSTDIAVSSYGVVNRIAMLVFMFMMGICMGMQPIAGYNYGAGLQARLKEVYLLSMKWNVGIGIVGTAVAMLFPQMLVGMFSEESDLISMAVPATRILMVTCPIIAFTVTNSQFFQSIDKPWIAIVTSLSRQVLFLIPLMYIVPILFVKYGGDGLTGVWYSMAISDCCGAILSGTLLFTQLKVFRPGYKAPQGKPKKELGPGGED